MIVIYLWQPYQRIVVQSFCLSHIVGVLLRIVYRQVMVQNIVYHTRRQESQLLACLCPAEATDSVQLFWLLTTDVIKSIAQSRCCFVTMVTSTTWSWTSRSFCNVATLTLSWHWKVKLRVTFINIFRWTEQSTLGNHGNPAAPLPSKGTFAKYWRKEGIFAKHWRNEGIFCHCLYRPEWTLIRGIFAKYWREEAIICFKFEYWVLSL